MVNMTPEQWRDKLSKRLTARALEVRSLRQWADGPHPWPTAPEALRLVLGRLCELAETNLCSLAVDAVAERLSVNGVKMSNDLGADVDHWRRIWQANYLDADQTVAYRDALVTRSSYILVTPQDDGDPLVTIEDPSECIIAYEPGNRRRRVAALKRYHDDDAGRIYATVWTPDEVVTWSAPRDGDLTPGARPRWVLDPDFPGGDNRLGVVPLVEMRCDGELGHRVITTQRRINMTMFRLLTVAEFQVVPQKYLIGADIEVDADGNAVNPLRAGSEHVWLIDAPDPSKVQIGQLPAAELDPIMKMIESDVTRFGAITKTPLYYVAGGLVNVSADAIRAAEAGLIAKVGKLKAKFGEAWEEVYRIALQAMDETGPPDIEVQWADSESRSLAERADAALKLQSAGYPFSAIARKMGESQSEIDRLIAERDQERAQTPAAPAA